MHHDAKAQFHQVVILGGGFGGLYAAKALRRAPVRVTLVDKRNFHLFQPLLYQVATGGVSPGDIAYPLRSVFARDAHFSVIMAEVSDIDVSQRTVILRDGSLTYDTLISRQALVINILAMMNGHKRPLD